MAGSRSSGEFPVAGGQRNRAANEREWEVLDGLVERVVGAIYEVANVLGAGFLEKVYERALMRELGLRGLKVRSQVAFPVGYKGHCVGEYLADLLVEERLIVELKLRGSVR